MSITVRTQGKPTWPPTARRGLASRELAQARHGASTVPRSEGAPRRHGPGPEQLSNGPAGPAPTARPRTPETECLHGRGGSVRQKLRGGCIKPRCEEPTDPRLAARTQAPARPGPGFNRCGPARWTMPQAVKGSRPLRAFTASPKGSHSRSGTDTLRPLGPTTSRTSPALGHRNGERGQPVAPSFSPPAATLARPRSAAAEAWRARPSRALRASADRPADPGSGGHSNPARHRSWVSPESARHGPQEARGGRKAWLSRAAKGQVPARAGCPGRSRQGESLRRAVGDLVLGAGCVTLGMFLSLSEPQFPHTESCQRPPH